MNTNHKLSEKNIWTGSQYTEKTTSFVVMENGKMENDYISRQAAIDAFDKQFWSLLNIPICKEIKKAAKDTIRALTSEDVVEVVRCKDCLFGYRYFDVQNGETDSWVECRNPDGLHRDVSEDGYCCASIERSKCK